MLAKRALLVLLEVVLIVGVIGCAPTIVSTDAGVFQHGKLYAASSKDMDAVYTAALYAMDKLQLQVTDKAKDVFAARVVAKSADGKSVCVTMKPEPGNKTSFEIAVKTLGGDEERSRKIYDEMMTGLTMKSK
jgi:hypothetical protein